MLRTNIRFYNDLWSRARLIRPEEFNTWTQVMALLPTAHRRLEVAPGLRPRLPLDGTHFIDISLPAVRRLRQSDGLTAIADITAIPFAAASFDIVAAFDVVEHVEDDRAAFAEIGRVAAHGAHLLLSVPLHQSAWTAFDDVVGHRRRYDPEELRNRLGEAGFVVKQAASFGMQPRNTWLVRLGMMFLTRHPAWAMWWYNRVFMPIGLVWAKPLAFKPGLADLDQADAVVLLCEKI